MNWFESIIYGFCMGFSEFLPISSGAQANALQQIFGAHVNDALRDLLVHISALCAFFIAWKSPFDFLHLSRQPIRNHHKQRRGSNENRDIRFVRAAIFPALLIMILTTVLGRSVSIIPMVLLLIVNGIIMYLPERMLRGNKNAGAMSSADAWLFGIASALCIIPGFSRMGIGISIIQMRGGDRRHAVNWAYLLSVPILAFLIIFDLINLTFGAQQLVLSTGFLGYVLLCITTFAGSYTSIYFMRNVIAHYGLCAFSYYSWGSALFLFILYLL